MANSTIYDVLIVGGGIAGLSAAMTLSRHLHTSLIFDNGKPRNAWPRPTHILPGFEGGQAKELKATSRAELTATGLVMFIERTASDVEHYDGGFKITDDAGEQWQGRKLLIAAGKANVFLDIPGYEENYPSRIYHCMFTFGYENRNADSAGLLAEGALGSPMHATMVLGDTRKFSKRVTVYTNGNDELEKELKERLGGLDGVTLDNRRITRIKGAEGGLQLEMDSGPTEVIEFLVHQPATKVSLPLVEKLGLKFDARGDIVNSPPFYATEVPGVFVAGDCAVPFKIIPAAIFTGANAGAGIARSLAADAMEKELAVKA